MLYDVNMRKMKAKIYRDRKSDLIKTKIERESLSSKISLCVNYLTYLK